MKRFLAVTGVVILLGLLAGTGLAHTQFVLDPDDTSGPLDIVTARLAHKAENGKRTLNLRLVTYETWTYESIDDTKQFVSFEINLDKDEAIERCLVVRAHTDAPSGGDPALGYSATVYKNCIYFDDELVKSYGTEHVSIPDAHSIQVKVPRRGLLGRGVGAYKWRAATSFEETQQNSPCPRPEPHGDGGYGSCFDVTKWQRHR